MTTFEITEPEMIAAWQKSKGPLDIKVWLEDAKRVLEREGLL